MKRKNLFYLSVSVFLIPLISMILVQSCARKASSVEDVIAAFKSGKTARIAKCFSFPYRRDYPFKTIETEKEFLAVFNEVLDEEIIQKIADSSPEDWQQIGWRGIALNNGDVWLSEADYKIIAVNLKTKDYQSNLEEKILLDKETLPLKLQNFKQPVAKYVVDDCIYRIDQLNDGNYRLLILTQNGIMFTLENGTLSFDGNGGSHYYTWNDFDGTNHIIYYDTFHDEVIYSVFMPEQNSENVDNIWKNVAKKLK